MADNSIPWWDRNISDLPGEVFDSLSNPFKRGLSNLTGPINPYSQGLPPLNSTVAPPAPVPPAAPVAPPPQATARPASAGTFSQLGPLPDMGALNAPYPWDKGAATPMANGNVPVTPSPAPHSSLGFSWGKGPIQDYTPGQNIRTAEFSFPPLSPLDNHSDGETADDSPSGAHPLGATPGFANTAGRETYSGAPLSDLSLYAQNHPMGSGGHGTFTELNRPDQMTPWGRETATQEALASADLTHAQQLERDPSYDLRLKAQMEAFPQLAAIEAKSKADLASEGGRRDAYGKELQAINDEGAQALQLIQAHPSFQAMDKAAQDQLTATTIKRTEDKRAALEAKFGLGAKLNSAELYKQRD